MLVLAIGDAHIPDRAIVSIMRFIDAPKVRRLGSPRDRTALTLSIHPKFRHLLAPGKISNTLALGNISDPSTAKLLKSISSEIHSVKGDLDVDGSLPLSTVLTYGQLRVGLVSGFTIIPNDDPDALLIAARQLDVDILLWGGSHVVETYKLESKLFVNPGSVTGAMTSNWGEDPIIPSFCLLDIQGTSCIVYIYSVVDDDVKVEKVTYNKS